MKRINTLILLALIITHSCAQSQEEDRGYIVKIGQIAPDFTLTTTEGKTFKLSDYRGKVVMIQFTASWCSVCRKEMPHIENEIWQPLRDKDFVLIGLDRNETAEVAAKFARTMKISYS